MVCVTLGHGGDSRTFPPKRQSQIRDKERTLELSHQKATDDSICEGSDVVATFDRVWAELETGVCFHLVFPLNNQHLFLNKGAITRSRIAFAGVEASRLIECN